MGLRGSVRRVLLRVQRTVYSRIASALPTLGNRFKPFVCHQ